MSLDPRAASAPEQPATTAQSANTKHTILLVDDEEGVREFVRAVLTQAGYTVTVARDGEEALALFRNATHRFDLVLTDVIMPKRTGPALATELHAIDPSLRVLFMSGFTGGSPTAPIELPPGAKIIAKPFSLDSLLYAIASALREKRSSET
jgi:DNA-binding NtrC family response regulator